MHVHINLYLIFIQICLKTLNVMSRPSKTHNFKIVRIDFYLIKHYQNDDANDITNYVESIIHLDQSS